MKKCLLLILFVTSLSFAQNTENYFPLAVGNKWVYNHYIDDETGIKGRFLIDVVGDTLVDGNKFFILVAKNEKLTGYYGDSTIFDYRKFYIRFDSTLNRFIGYSESNVFYTALNLNMLQQSSYYQSMFGYYNNRLAYIDKITTKRIFNEAYNSKLLLYNDNDYNAISYSENVGIDSIRFSEHYYLLKGMVKDGIVFGDTSLSFPNPLSYYPLAIGNKWFYEYTFCTSDMGYNCSTEKKIWFINKDTIINGKRYFEFYQNEPEPLYQRIDSSNNFVYQWDSDDNQEYVVFDLNMDFNKRGEYLPLTNSRVGYVELNKFDSLTIFGNKASYKHYIVSSLYWNYFSLIDGIGLDNMFIGLGIAIGNYHLVGMIKDGVALSVDNNDFGDKIPDKYVLNMNYPNPFNPSTTISYSIPKEGRVIINIYNVIGKEVAQLVNEYKTAGTHQVKFNADNLPSGIYLYKISVNDFSATNKMVLIK